VTGVLIVVPPSESKRPPPERGRPVALGELSFPALTLVRERVLDALITTCARRDAFRRLLVGPSLADEVARDARLLEQPARPALQVYTGPLHDGLDAATLSQTATERASRSLIVASALWGALRPVDRIPSYRLHVCARLFGMDRLEPTWRTVLPDVLAAAAGPHGIVLDLRSPSYQAIGMPSGLGDRTITLRVRQELSTRRVGDVVAKRVRGQAARHLLESGADLDDPERIARVLGERWPVRLDPPTRPGSASVMTLAVSA
jgi:cytoplasmic iron level regulating protein YaaA (DUF328/UPF0246 family)